MENKKKKDKRPKCEKCGSRYGYVKSGRKNDIFRCRSCGHETEIKDEEEE
ncbi:MAG: hypothetical protein ACOC1X_02220 [Promethearchaeota archaeon]